jgi:hypothetical protein
MVGMATTGRRHSKGGLDARALTRTFRPSERLIVRLSQARLGLAGFTVPHAHSGAALMTLTLRSSSRYQEPAAGIPVNPRLAGLRRCLGPVDSPPVCHSQRHGLVCKIESKRSSSRSNRAESPQNSCRPRSPRSRKEDGS